MKATELRIGNLVNYKIVDELDERKEWYEVSTIDSEDLNNIDEDYQPILLDEEWLLKFGFEKFIGWDDMIFYREKNWHLISEEFFELYKCNLGFLFMYFREINIKYVHQLQNLYFALTNKELTIKNEK